MGQQIAGAVDQGRVVGHGLLGGADRGEDLVLYLDHALGLLQDLRALRHHQADGIPQIVGHAAHGNHGIPVLHQMAHLVLPRDVLRSEHGGYAGQGQRLLPVDGLDNGAGMGGADGGGVEHPIHGYIVRIEARPLDLLRHVHPVDPCPHLPGARILRQASGAEDRRRPAHALDNLHIPRTAADIVAQGVPDLCLRGIRVLVQQGLGGHDHTGDAKAALHCPRLTEGVGVGRPLELPQALHGQHALALQPVGAQHAGAHRLAVHQDGTGPAGPLAAPILGRSEMQLVPQKAQQLLVPLRCHGPAVYNKCRHVSFSFFAHFGMMYRITSYNKISYNKICR